MKQKMVRKKVLSAKQLQQMIDSYKQMLPQWISSPFQLMNAVLFYFSSILLFSSYFLLVGQSILVLSSDKKNANLRFVLLKWILISVNVYFSEYLREQNNHNEPIVFLANLVCFFFIYPFQFSRKLILKYTFQGKNKTSTDQLDMSFSSTIPLFHRFIIWMLVLVLTICKYVLTFIHPSHRKQIQLKIKEINMILIQQKYFWKIYDINIASLKLQKSVSSLRDSQNQLKKKDIESPRITNMKKQSSQEQIGNINYIKKPTRQNKQVPPPLKYSAHMYIPVLGGLNKGVDSAKRRYTFYCEMEFQYNLSTTQIKVVIPGQDKPHYYNLKQVQNIQNDLIRLSFQEDSQQPQIIIKFNSNQDRQTFLQKINSFES